MKDLLAEQIPRLRRYARALLRSVGAADDLVQDTLERAWSRRHLWREDSDLRAWLFTIMHNVFVNQYHRAALAPPTIAMEAETPVPQNDSSPEENLVARDLANALAQLSPDLREVIVLVGVEQMRYEDVARILEIPIGTVMSRLSRARERLRLLMAGQAPSSLRRIK